MPVLENGTISGTINDDTVIITVNDIKNYLITQYSDQFYYFSKEKIDYTIIGSLDIEPFNELISFIQELISSGVKIKQVLDNSADIW